MTPCSRSSSGTRLPTSTNILEPPVRQAFSLISTSSSRRQVAFGEFPKDHIGGHDLGKAGRFQALVGIALGQNHVAVVVDQQVAPRAQLGRVRDWHLLSLNE